jgi:hypothetical protein
MGFRREILDIIYEFEIKIARQLLVQGRRLGNHYSSAISLNEALLVAISNA